MLAVSLLAAISLHTAGLWLTADEPKVKIAAGAGAAEARIGSFADMAAGVARPVTARTDSPQRPVDRTLAPVAPEAAPQPLAATLRPTGAMPVAPAPQTPPVVAATPRPDAATRPVPAPRPQAPPPPTAKPVLAEAASPTGPRRSVTATPGPAQGLGVSRRPKRRPDTVEAAARERQAERVTRQSQMPDHPARQPAQTGTNAARDAMRGSVTGRASAPARRAGRQDGDPSESTGNAAVSNYPGQVMAWLSRVARPRIGNRGTAVVQFTVAPDGRLAGLRVTRGSGSARLDRAALAMVRRAAPFPRPPRGGRRSFSVTVRGQ